MSFKTKMVAVVNKSLEPGVALNAVAHMCMGLGASLGREFLELMDYTDHDGGSHANISKMPLIVLRATSSKIRGLREKAIEEEIPFTDYIDTMTGGTWEQQQEKTAAKRGDELNYFGIMLVGDVEKVGEWTKKMSLYK